MAETRVEVWDCCVLAVGEGADVAAFVEVSVTLFVLENDCVAWVWDEGSEGNWVVPGWTDEVELGEAGSAVGEACAVLEGSVCAFWEAEEVAAVVVDCDTCVTTR